MLLKKKKRKRNRHKNNRNIVEEVVIFSNKKKCRSNDHGSWTKWRFGPPLRGGARVYSNPRTNPNVLGAAST